ncbi:hypothetical protein [Aquitalea palustris]|uniref:hypothetical protein n=1 Tax=Aquitalea palustris TaxID=2480983 RepID=UPI001CF0B531|nr:hypothetical protein [Aquitalea palustris]
MASDYNCLVGLSNSRQNRHTKGSVCKFWYDVKVRPKIYFAVWAKILYFYMEEEHPPAIDPRYLLQVKPVMTTEDRSEFVQTRCPGQIIVYLKGLAMLRYGTLVRMHDDMLRKFLMSQPWAADPPLSWRTPRSAQTNAGREAPAQTGWKTFNMQMSPDLKQVIAEKCDELEISMSTFCYTAIYWWCKYIFPPQK